MTTEMSIDGHDALHTSVEDPEAAKAAHEPMPIPLRRRQQLRRDPGLPFEDGSVVDVAQEGEKEPCTPARRIEAERGVEVDDAGTAVCTHQDIVALAQVDVGHPARMDLRHQVDEPLEQRGGLPASR